MPFPSGLRIWKGGNASIHLAFVGTALVAVSLSTCPQHPEPDSVAELLGRLRGAGLDWNVTAVRKGGEVEEGVYLCDRPRGWEDLLLLRQLEYASRWDGVVYVEKNSPALLQEDWGEHGLVVGKLVLFGDPRMLQEVRRALGR
jgi:hypothetical protein